MNRFCDLPGEMPDDRRLDELDDESIEWILDGRPVADAGLAPLAGFAFNVRAVADRRVPRPNAELAQVLVAGFSTEKGDLLVTAGSNDNRRAEPPEPQAAAWRGPSAIKLWRRRHSMLPTGFLSGLPAKIVAGVVAGLAGVTAVGAAGALPGPAQHAVASVVEAVTPFNLPDGDASAAIGLAAGTTSGGPTAASDVNAGTTGADVNISAGASGASPLGVANGKLALNPDPSRRTRRFWPRPRRKARVIESD